MQETCGLDMANNSLHAFSSTFSYNTCLTLVWADQIFDFSTHLNLLEHIAQCIQYTKAEIVNIYPLKILCHKLNIFMKAYYKIGTFCTCADSFYKFLFLSWWKNVTQSLSLLNWNFLLLLKILPVARFKAFKAAILTQQATCEIL